MEAPQFRNKLCYSQNTISIRREPRMNKRLIAAFLSCASSLALAQAQPLQPLGKVTEARGVVTVSDGTTVGIAERGTAFFDGTRFVSSPSGRAELTLDNGCKIRLEPSQSLVVRDKISCDALMALVQPVSGAPAFAGAGAISNGTALRVAGIAGAALLMSRDGGSGTSSSGGGGGGIPVPPISGQ